MCFNLLTIFKKVYNKTSSYTLFFFWKSTCFKTFYKINIAQVVLSTFYKFTNKQMINLFFVSLQVEKNIFKTYITFSTRINTSYLDTLN